MKQFSIKLYEIWRYVLWFIIIQAFTSYFLIYSNIIKLNGSESIVGYILFNDVILTFSYFMLSTVFSVYLGAFISSKTSHKDFLKKDVFKFKYKFTKYLVDIILKFFITISALSIRLKDIQELSSLEKLQYIGFTFFIIFILMTLIKAAFKSIGVELITLIDLIGAILLMPICFYQNMKADIINSDVPDNIKKIFICMFFVFCIIMFIAIICALISVFATVFISFSNQGT